MSKRSGCGLWPIIFLVGLAGVSGTMGASGSPLDYLDPFCGVSNRYTTTARIVHQGSAYESTVTRRVRYVRGWIRNLNSAGCKDSIGNSHIFRTSSGRVIMFPAGICSKASRQVIEEGSTDALATCKADHRDWEPSGTVVDNADNPRFWQPFWFKGRALPGKQFYDGVKLIEWTAIKAQDEPSDTYDDLVPQMLEVNYESAPFQQIGSRAYKTQFWPKGRIAHGRGESRLSGQRREVRYKLFLK